MSGRSGRAWSKGSRTLRSPDEEESWTLHIPTSSRAERDRTSFIIELSEVCFMDQNVGAYRGETKHDRIGSVRSPKT